MFKARLISLPEGVDKDTKEKVHIGQFTIGRKYGVYSIYDNGQFTDFLVADDLKIFRWININSFRAP